MNGLKHIAPIIKESSKSLLGVLSLIIIALSAVAYFSFQDSSDAAKSLMFVSLIIGTVIFVIAITKASTKTAGFIDRIMKYQPTEDQFRDIELFLQGKRNLMDEQQLAQDQMQAFQIKVVAPEPLELGELGSALDLELSGLFMN